MKEIQLTQGKSAQVDDSDYDWLNQSNWFAQKVKHTYYAKRGVWINGKQKTIYMHREIMDTPVEMEVDHQDHNGLNCQRHNMRNATVIQNRRNKNAYGRSEYLGVSYHRNTIKGKLYVYIIAQICISGKQTHLGCFKSEVAAAKARDIASKKYYGEFANLNFKEA